MNETIIPNASPDLTTTPRQAFSRTALALFVVAVTAIVSQVAVSALLILFSAQGQLTEGSWVTWLATFLPMYLIAFPLGSLVLLTLPKEDRPARKLGTKTFWTLLLICFPLMYTGSFIGNLFSLLFSGGGAENGLTSYAMDTSLLKILFMVVLAPLLEELVFRKWILDRLGRYGEKTAILFSALCFGLFHMNLYQFFYATALGLIFGYVYLRTNRLRYSVLLHMIINFMGSVVAPWVLSTLDMEKFQAFSESSATDLSLLQEILPGLLVYMSYLALLAILFVTGLVLLILFRKRAVFLPAAQELEPGKRFTVPYLNPGFGLFFLVCAVMFVLALIPS